MMIDRDPRDKHFSYPISTKIGIQLFEWALKSFAVHVL